MKQPGQKPSSLTKRALVLLMSPLMATGIGLMAGSAAHAAPSSSLTAAETQRLLDKAQEADARGYIVVDRSEAKVVGDAVFYPTGPISDDTLVIINDADGTLPNGLTEASLDAFVAQKRSGQLGAASSSLALTADQGDVGTLAYHAWSASNAAWSQAYWGDSLIGLNDSATAGYYFYTVAGYAQRASGNGLGYYRGYNGSVFGTWSKWYFVGIASSTGAGAAVPWGNVAATK